MKMCSPNYVDWNPGLGCAYIWSGRKKWGKKRKWL